MYDLPSVVTHLFYSLMILVWIFVVAILRDLLSSGEKQLRERIRQLEEEIKAKERDHKEEVERLRQRYEMLLRDAAVKNVVMSALYHAWRSGELKKCYNEKGEVKILADGTVLCDKGKPEESYTIRGDDDADK